MSAPFTPEQEARVREIIAEVRAEDFERTLAAMAIQLPPFVNRLVEPEGKSPQLPPAPSGGDHD